MSCASSKTCDAACSAPSAWRHHCGRASSGRGGGRLAPARGCAAALHVRIRLVPQYARRRCCSSSPARARGRTCVRVPIRRGPATSACMPPIALSTGRGRYRPLGGGQRCDRDRGGCVQPTYRGGPRPSSPPIRTSRLLDTTSQLGVARVCSTPRRSRVSRWPLQPARCRGESWQRPPALPPNERIHQTKRPPNLLSTPR